MGLVNYVRNRKQVKADRAESGSHKKLVDAMTRPNPTTAWRDSLPPTPPGGAPQGSRHGYSSMPSVKIKNEGE